MSSVVLSPQKAVRLLEALIDLIPMNILLTQTSTGWIVARTHRAAAIPMVVVFVTWLTLWFFADSFSEAKRLLVNSIDQPRFRMYLAWYLTPIALEIVGILCGGIFGSRRQKGRQSTLG